MTAMDGQLFILLAPTLALVAWIVYDNARC
jgi:hypothetical protein